MTRAAPVPSLGSVAVSFAALDGDPFPRDRQTGHFLRVPAANQPEHWGPVLRALGDPASRLRGSVSDWYYICHPERSEGRTAAATATEVALDLEAALQTHLGSALRPRFHKCPWQTTKSPHDHADLFERLKDQLRAIRKEHPEAELVLVLSAGTQAMHTALLLGGSIGVVEGPIRLVQIHRGRLTAGQDPIVEVSFRLDTVLQLARETAPARPVSDDTPTFGYDQAKSPALKAAIEEARRAARVRFPILLRGERGVGKSTLARFIRAMSPHRLKKRDRDWPAIACGQLVDPQRLLLELFGSVKGAFTGAVDKPGLLALADRDTLFLDEIHDMSDGCQRVLIRTIEDGVYYPLGSDVAQKSSFRLITGTNLEESELRARLAADFYDRIRDIEIRIPPLRECRDDLPWMWDEQWTAIVRQSGAPSKSLESHRERILRALVSSTLPGNWRDLRRLAIRLAVTATSQPRLSAVDVSDALTALQEASIVPERHRGAYGWTGRDKNYLSTLESALGPGLEKFWRERTAGPDRSPQSVLEELLGDRHKARRAATFIRRTFPGR